MRIIKRCIDVVEEGGEKEEERRRGRGEERGEEGERSKDKAGKRERRKNVYMLHENL